MKNNNNLDIRTTRSILHSITPSKEIQNQIMDDALMKSYMFQAAAKSKRKQPIQRISEYEKAHEIIRQSHNKQRKNKIFRSVMRVNNTTTKYKLLMSNVVGGVGAFSCCDAKHVKQPVVVYLSQWKEITVKNNKENQMLYHFNFNTIEAKVQFYDIDTESFMLEISKQIILKFQNSDKNASHAAQSLKNDLKKMIDNSLGLQYRMNDLKQVPNFHKLFYKPASQFGQHCQTGDILLFRGNLFWAKVQRFVLNSDYDHVGMVYKDPIHGILIFQSTSANGICLSPWEYVLKYKWYSFIQRITWRKLEKIQRNYQFVQKMQQLIIQNLGKTYDISFDKILSNQSYIQPKSQGPSSKSNSQIQSQNNTSKDQKQEQQQHLLKIQQNKKQAGYFCSELIAKIYKGLNLLSSDKKQQHYKPSCNFYPYHFTKKFPLHLLEGELSEEYIIHFDEEQIQDCYNFKS